jgi:hypothetical protein
MAKQNSIHASGKTVSVILDPNYVISNSAFTPQGNSIGPSGYTIGQAIQGLATAVLATKAPQLMKDFQCAKVAFESGKFVISLYETEDEMLVDDRRINDVYGV